MLEEIGEGGVDLRLGQRPTGRVLVHLAAGQLVVRHGVGVAVVIRVAGAEAGVAQDLQIHEPADVAVEQGANGRTLAAADPDLAELASLGRGQGRLQIGQPVDLGFLAVDDQCEGRSHPRYPLPPPPSGPTPASAAPPGIPR